MLKTARVTVHYLPHSISVSRCRVEGLGVRKDELSAWVKLESREMAKREGRLKGMKGMVKEQGMQ